MNYEVVVFDHVGQITQRDWDDNQSSILAKMKQEAVMSAARWIVENGMVEIQTEHDILRQRYLVSHTVRALKEKK